MNLKIGIFWSHGQNPIGISQKIPELGFASAVGWQTLELHYAIPMSTKICYSMLWMRWRYYLVMGSWTISTRENFSFLFAVLGYHFEFLIFQNYIIPTLSRVATCTGMYWMYWEKKCTGKCTGKHILFMACTGNVLGFFKIRPNIFYGYFGEPISPILPHVFTKFSRVSHILIQVILLVSESKKYSAGV